MKNLFPALLLAVTAVELAGGQEFARCTIPATAPAGCAAPCEGDCLNKVCVPQPGKSKTTRTVYDVKSIDYCLTKCPVWVPFSRCGRGGGCGTECCIQCGKPRTRNILVKKFVTEERDTCNCVPVVIEAPSCPAACWPSAK